MPLNGSSPVDGLDNKVMVVDPLDDSTKENASVVDSSLSESKHQVKDCDGQESSCGRNTCSEGEIVQSFCEDSESCPRNEKQFSRRYFIIKSLSHQNIQLSVEKGIWATQLMNEPILEEAFRNSHRVILIFSVNMSGFFQGYAQMMSSVGWRRDNVWSKSSGGSNPWGRTFKIKWLRLHDLPFQKTLHLKNPLNDYKPVKISRDCQELSEDIGEALCELFHGEVDIKGKHKRNCLMDEKGQKRPCKNFQAHLQDEDCVLSASSSHIWGQANMLHPSLFYQHNDHSHFLRMEGSPMVSIFQESSSDLDLQRVSTVKQPNLYRSSSNVKGPREHFPQPNRKGIFDGRNSAISISEEDILDMTYEEYLQAIERNCVNSTAGPSWKNQGGHKSGAQSNDEYVRKPLFDCNFGSFNVCFASLFCRYSRYPADRYSSESQIDQWPSS
ncbi:uncharacterized protein [Typha latifolia]|uniref:uncharacterized protein isoform X2 n=1 Tax=Typha latifolia TaxID=4733 RepID=UPI003C2C8E92